MEKQEKNENVSEIDPKQENQAEAQNEEETKKMIRVNGFQQVVEMLAVADNSFRESLLQRISQRNASLAESLRRDLNQLQTH